MVGLDLDAILRVPDIQQQDIKVEDGIRRDEVTCTGEITCVIADVGAGMWVQVLRTGGY